MYFFYILLRYLKIKEGTHRSEGATGKVLYLISGRAPHSHFEGKKVIEGFYKMARLINGDP